MEHVMVAGFAITKEEWLELDIEVRCELLDLQFEPIPMAAIAEGSGQTRLPLAADRR